MPESSDSNNSETDLIINSSISKEEMIKNLDSNFDKTIEDIINKNNKDKLNQIKFIIRNMFMSLIWSFSFFKLSKIHCG